MLIEERIASLVASTRSASAAGAVGPDASPPGASLPAEPESVTTSVTSGPGRRDARILGAGTPIKTRSGTPVLHCTRCSARSSSNGSAHWRSSRARTTGCVTASAARKRRTAKNVSSGDRGAPASNAATPPAMRTPSGSSPPTRAATACRTASSPTVSSTPRSVRTASASAVNVPPPAAQGAVSTIACPPRRRVSRG